MNAKLNILVVGGGMYVICKETNNFGTIMPALLEARRNNLVDRIAVVTTNPSSANKAINRITKLANKMGVDGNCEKFPIDGYNDEGYLFAADSFKPDAVIISVPDHLHAPISIALINKGYHCLIVKPMAPTLNDAKQMTLAAEKANVIAQVEFHKRLDESNLILNDTVRSGRLGDLLYAVVEYSQKKKIPRDIFHSWAEKTSIFQYLGVHYVDLLQFITSFEPIRVSAWGQKGYLKEIGIDTWDSMQVVVEWDRKDGELFISNHITNWIDPDESTAMSNQKINIVGTKGRFQADQKNRGVQIVEDSLGVSDVNPYFSKSWQDPSAKKLYFNGYGIRSIIQFIEDVDKLEAKQVTLSFLEENRPSFKVCTVSTAVIEAAHKSLANKNRPVKVKL